MGRTSRAWIRPVTSVAGAGSPPAPQRPMHTAVTIRPSTETAAVWTEKSAAESFRKRHSDALTVRRLG